MVRDREKIRKPGTGKTVPGLFYLQKISIAF